MLSERSRRVVLIGPECTGKTWLAGELSAHYRAPSSPEFAREFVDRHPRPLSYEDVETIGLGQKAREDAARERARLEGARLVIHDTDLVSTMVYSRHYYGRCPAWIEAEARARLADLYLLHHVDLPWTADGFQREEPGRRQEQFERFRRTLADWQAAAVDIAGSWAERRIRATEAIDALLAK